MLDLCKSLLYLGLDGHACASVCAEDWSEDVRFGAGLHIVIRGGVRWCHSEGACEMCCHDVKWSEEVYMCASRAGLILLSFEWRVSDVSCVVMM